MTTAGSPSHPTEDPRPRGVAVAATIAWTLGITLGHQFVRAEPWLIAGAVFATLAITMALRRRPRGARTWAMLALLAMGAAWVILRTGYVQPIDVRQYLFDRSQLVQVTGFVEDPPRPRDPPGGALDRFSHRTQGSTWVLDLQSIVVGHDPKPCTGRLRVELRSPTDQLEVGDCIQLSGWLRAPSPPANPGELDLPAVLARQDIAAYLSARDIGGVTILRHGGWLARVSSLRQRLSDSASDSLTLGMSPDALRLELLDALLLGRRSPQPDGIGQSFRRVGLAHLMAISGAHLSVLLGLTWLLVRLAIPRPAWATAAVLLVLAGYLLIVPPHVPILRSGIMAAVLALAYGSGRRTQPFQVLSLSALALLIWRPNDLFDAGFQLSFVTVAAVLLFVPALAQRLWPSRLAVSDPDSATPGTAAPPAAALPGAGAGAGLLPWVGRWVADYLAFNVVAGAFALPLVAFHFGAINPPGLGMSILSFPLVALVMALGFMKIVVGWVYPSLGMLLARPLEWSTGLMSAAVDHVAAWPGARVPLPQTPSALWAAVTLGALAAVFGGWFARRRLAAVGAIACCAVWLALPNVGFLEGRAPSWAASPLSIRVNALDVGDGNCFLIRLADGQAHYTLMYDCGSDDGVDLGNRVIVPALGTLGVDHIDTLVISSSDPASFSGALDLVGQVPVGRVLTTRYVLDTAKDRSGGPAGALLRGLRQRGLSIETAARGWQESRPGADIRVVWPPPDMIRPPHDQTSLVLDVRTAGRRVLLCGDIREAGISALLDTGDDMHCDLSDLPHRGAFFDASPRWLAAVSPALAIQSAGRARLEADPWPALLQGTHTQRLMTARQGMIQWQAAHDGTMTWNGFRSDPP